MVSCAWVKRKRFANKNSKKKIFKNVQVIVFKDPAPAATSTPERKVTASKVETAVQVAACFFIYIQPCGLISPTVLKYFLNSFYFQVSPRLVEGSTQVEEADTAVAKAKVLSSYY